MKKLPISIQTFEKIREADLIYVALSRRALKQIQAKKYYEAYLGNDKRVLLLGLGFLDKQLHGRVEEIS